MVSKQIINQNVIFVLIHTCVIFHRSFILSKKHSTGTLISLSTLFEFLSSIMHGKDYWKEGRTVDKLGIAGLSVKEIRQLVVGIE